MAQVNVQKTPAFLWGLADYANFVWRKVDAVQVAHQFPHFCNGHRVDGNLLFLVGKQVDGNFSLAKTALVLHFYNGVIFAPTHKVFVLVGSWAFSNATQVHALHKVGFALSVVSHKNIQSAVWQNLLLFQVAIVGNFNFGNSHTCRFSATKGGIFVASNVAFTIIPHPRKKHNYQFCQKLRLHKAFCSGCCVVAKCAYCQTRGKLRPLKGNVLQKICKSILN